jgi:hypothetical protein
LWLNLVGGLVPDGSQNLIHQKRDPARPLENTITPESSAKEYLDEGSAPTRPHQIFNWRAHRLSSESTQSAEGHPTW